MLKNRFETIFFDADDTLWENEMFFRQAEEKFAELLADYTDREGLQTDATGALPWFPGKRRMAARISGAIASTGICSGANIPKW